MSARHVTVVLAACMVVSLAADAMASPVAVPSWNPKGYVPILGGSSNAYGIVRLDGSASYETDPGLSLTNWQWKVQGAALFVSGEVTSMQVQLGSLLGMGPVYRVLQLSVTDDVGLVDTELFTVAFKRLSSTPPTIVFDKPRSGFAISKGTGFSISAAASYDSDSSDWFYRVAWDLNNDGTDDIVRTRTDANGDGAIDGLDPTPSLDLAMNWAEMGGYPDLQTEGSHEIRLTLQDSAGVTAWDTVRMQIEPAAAVPEPHGMVLFATGVAAVFGLATRRKVRARKPRQAT